MDKKEAKLVIKEFCRSIGFGYSVIGGLFITKVFIKAYFFTDGKILENINGVGEQHIEIIYVLILLPFFIYFIISEFARMWKI